MFLNASVSHLFSDSINGIVGRWLEAVVGAGQAEDGLVAVGDLDQELRKRAHQHVLLLLFRWTEDLRAKKEIQIL